MLWYKVDLFEYKNGNVGRFVFHITMEFCFVFHFSTYSTLHLINIGYPPPPTPKKDSAVIEIPLNLKKKSVVRKV